MTREEAVNIIKKCKEMGFKHTFYTLNDYHTALEMAIKALEQEPKTGHWIDTGSGQKCSECGEIQHGYDSFRYFCANCGARMEVENG